MDMLHLLTGSISGHMDAVRFLTATCKVNPHVKDR